MRRAVAVLMVTLLQIAILTSVSDVNPENTVTINVPDDYPTIQEAINSANDGDTIFVRNGTYYENVVVNKTISLIGEDRDSTTIDGGANGTVVTIEANSVTMTRFCTQNSGGSYSDYGIYIHSNNNNLTNNLITNNKNGLTIVGGNNVLRNNSLANNIYNFGVWGSSLGYFQQDIDSSNTINAKPIYFIVGRNDLQVPDDVGYVGIVDSSNITISNLTLENNGQGILLAYSTDCSIRTSNIWNNRFGVDLRSSSGNSITQSSFLDNEVGVYIYYSDNNMVERNSIIGLKKQAVSGVEIHWSDGSSIIENIIQNVTSGGIGIWGSYVNKVLHNDLENAHYGIVLDSRYTIIIGNRIQGSYEGMQIQNSHYNTLYHNNFMNNTMDMRFAQPYSFDDVWDNGCEGNYWSNYNGTDLNGDGIGDTNLAWERVDSYPLMNLYWNPADIDHDLDVDIFDVVRCAGAYGSTSSSSNWNPHCDIAEPYGIVNIFDIVTIAVSYGEEYTPQH